MIVEFCENPFVNINTENKFLKMLQCNDLYEKPNIITMNNTIENTVLNNVNTINEKKTKGVLLSLKFQFETFFELPGIMNEFLKNYNLMTFDNQFFNFINRELWKKKLNYKNKIVISFFLYFDDSEINNPLSSHSSSTFGIYYTFLPNYLNSSLKNIFVAALFKTKDVKQLGNGKTSYILIQEINELETIGVEIKLPNQNLRLYFVLGLVVDFVYLLFSIFCRFCVVEYVVFIFKNQCFS